MKVFFTFLSILGILSIGAQSITPKASCSNPIPIDFTVSISSNYNGQAISCNGECDAEVTVTVNSAGGGPYGFQFFDGDITVTQAADVPGGGTSSTFTGLCADNFNWTVIDSSQNIFNNIYESCTEFGFIINDPNNIGVNVLGFQDPTCPDSCDGRIFASIGGGTAPLNILWIESGSTTASPTGVCTGINTVEVTDANNCFFTTVVDVNDPSQINFGITIQDVTCDGVCDAAITSAPSGSNGGPYNFGWNRLPAATQIDTATGVSDHTASGLCENISYQLLLKDVNGCPFDTTIIVPDVLPMIITENPSIDASCANLCDGELSINVTGGSGNYTLIEWFEGTIGSGVLHNTGTNMSLNDLCPNTDYYVEVSDDNGCTKNLQLTPISAPPAFNFSETHNDVTCNADGNGSINFSISGGTPNYNYSWTTSDGSGLNPSSQDQSGLSGGNYHLVFVDDNNCTDSIDIEILEPDAIVTNGTTSDVSCFDLLDGSIDLTTTGGNGGYVWTWTSTPNGTASLLDPSQEDQANLDSAVYSVNIVDALGCTYDTSLVINKPGEIFFNAIVTQMDCFGDNDASIELFPSNGVPTFTIDWGNPINQLDGPTSQTGLSADTYDVTVTDLNGCDKDTSIILIEPLELVASETHTDIICNADNNGEITISMSGGTAPLTLTWSSTSGTTPSINETNPTNLEPGDYTATIEDANGCQEVLNITIDEPSALSLTITGTDLPCNGIATGSISIVPSGGIISTDYLYDWNNDGTGDFDDTQNLINQLAGTYCVNIQDDNGCTLAADSCFTIIEPDSIFFNGSSHTDITCFGDNNGLISLVITGGTEANAYDIIWNPVPACYGGSTSSQLISNLCPGDYEVTVEDDNGCTNDTLFTIVEPLQLNISETHTEVECFNSSTGSIDISVSGGVTPLTVTWTSTSSETPSTNDLNPVNLPAGVYTATVTDNNNCSESVVIDLVNPAQMSVAITGTDLTCNNAPDGTVSIVPSGGVITTDYLYDWDNDGTGDFDDTQNLTNLLAGTYCVNIQDDNGCVLTIDSCFTILEPDSIHFPGSLHTDITCFGDNDGTINLTVIGGTEVNNYDFNWSPVPSCYSGATNTQNLSNLCPGDYTVTATDDNGCSNDTIFTIVEPNLLNISETHSDLSCFGDNDGLINISVSGGIAPLTVTWISNTGTTPGINNLNPTNLEPGDYTATVTDDNNCTNFVDVTINTPSPLSMTLTGTDLSCNGVPDGEITTSASGGTVAGAYTYSWTGPNGFTSGLPNLTSLEAGTYCVNIEDDNGCILTPDSCVVLSEPDSIYFAGSTFTDMDCFAANNGEIDLTVIGGTESGAYDYNWNIVPGCYSGATNIEDLVGLCDGIYEVTVTDDNGCTNDTTFTVTEPIELTLSTSSTDAGCGIDNGSVTVTPSGGTVAGSYNIAWSGVISGFSGSNTTENGLEPDTYNVVITDDNGCSANGQETVSTVNPPLITIDNITDLLCNSECIGAIQISVSGGVAPYDIQWVGANTGYTSSSEDIFSLCADEYTLSVTDANLCEEIQVIIIDEPDALELSSNIVTPVDCFGNLTGAIDITPIGGTIASNYVFNWSGDNSMNATTEDVSGLAPGTYCVNITDDNGCDMATDSCFVITEPTELVIDDISSTDAQCNVPSGSATVLVSGGTIATDYTYSWDDPGAQTTATASNIVNNVYTVIVSDDNGCSATASVAVNPTNGPAVTLDNFSDVTCAGSGNGTISTSATGGSGGLTYTWSSIPAGFTAGNVPDVSGLDGGTYVLTVTDGAACNSFITVDIVEPAPLSIAANVTNANCFGEDGFIDITVTGGTVTTDYGYDWDYDGGASFSDPADVTVPAGTYNVSVIDDNSCVLTGGPYVLTQPTEISLTASANPSACTQSTGSVSVVATDGTPGNAPNEYTYVWTNPSSVQIGNTPTVNALPSDCYDVLVTENRPNGCEASTSICISDLNGPTVTDNVVNTTCNGGADGSIDLTVVSATGNDTFVWTALNGSTINPSSTDQNINGLAADEYSVTVTDQNGCSTGLTVDLTEPTAISISASIIEPLCSSSADGTVDITINDAVLPITSINWTGPNGFTSTSEDLIDLEVGQYCVTVIDGNGCRLDTCVTLSAPDGLILTTNALETDCSSPTGQVSATASGGIPGYTFDWTGPGGPYTGDIQSGLDVGVYNLTVTDINGCTATASETVSALNAPTVTVDAVNDVDCFGNATGDVFISVSGGTPNYTYDWDNLPGTNDPEDQIGLPAGTYNITVTDNAGCSAVETATISEPTAALNIAATQTDLECNGINNGEINITVTGGTADYTYVWSESGNLIASSSNSTGLNSVTGLSALTYDVLVTDNNGCTTTDSYTLTEATSIELITSSVDPSCGASDGEVSVSATGGTDGITYTYNWIDFNTGIAQTPGNLATQSSIPQGTYEVTVTDLNGCTATELVSISDGGGPSVTGVVSDVNCFGDADGQIDITPVGAATFTFSWTGPSTAATEDLIGVEAGNYAVAVTDINGCTSNENFTIGGPTSPIDVTATTIDNTCFGDLVGEINATVTGGTPSYIYSWVGPNGFTATTEDISSLAAGTYTLDIEDNNGCLSQGNDFVINEPNELILTPTITEPACGQSDGVLSVAVTGGLNPMTFIWTDLSGPVVMPDTDNDIANIFAGNYEVQVTDDNSCSTTQVFAVSNDVAPAIAVNQTNPLCFGDNNGEIDITIASIPGNTYTYDWDTDGTGDNDDTEDLTGLTAGTYNVTVIESPTGCISTSSVTLNNNDLLEFTGSSTDLACFNDGTGSIDINVVGGTVPYFFDWDNDGTGDNDDTEDLSGLSAGTYQVIVSDNNGCQSIDAFILTEPNQIDITATVVNNNCNAETNGSIDITASNGVSPYTYQWDIPSTNEDQSNLAAGNYLLTITDDNNCSRDSLFTITEPEAFIFNASVTDANCNIADGDITTNVSGGVLTSPDYTYDWQFGGTSVGSTADLLGQFAGTYTLFVTDDNGCTGDTTIIINNINAPVITVDNITDVLCANDDNGSIDITVTLGTAPYTYLWNPNGIALTEDIANIPAGTYSVQVTDDVGCITTETGIVVDSPDELTATSVITESTCGDCNGEATVTPVGGTGNVSFVWSNGPTSATASALCAGVYTVQLTDDNGCIANEDIAINNTGGPTGENLTTTDASCGGGADGTALVEALGGTAPYNYIWPHDGSTGDTQSSLAAGTYFVEMIDDNGCIRVAQVDIEEPSLITISSTINPSTCGNADGDITITTAGGVAPLNILWTNPAGPITPGVSGLTAGTYSVTVTDNNGCSASENFTISDITGPLLTLSPADALCNGDATGSITSNVSGAVGNTTYQWSDATATPLAGETNPDLIDYPAGEYTLTITDDGTGCTTVQSAIIEESDALQLSLPNIIDASCTASCDGIASVIVAGGTLPYSYNWSSGDVNPTASNLCAGIQTVTVTDANGCTIQNSLTIGESNTLAATVAEVDAACGVCDGVATVTGTGGSGNYTIDWYDGTSGTNHAALCAGIYPYTVIDNTTGCQIDLEATINNIDGPDNETIIVTDATCAGGTDGGADVTVSGGTLPYDYLWTPTGQTSNALTNVTAGTYNLEVSDANNCKRVIPVTIGESSDIVIDYLSTGTNCGSSDGSITLIISGGVAPYTTSWNGPSGFTANTTTESNLAPGAYTIQVTDNLGCSKTVTIPLGTTTTPIAVVNTTDISCFGVNDGTATVVGVGQDYEWQDGSTTATISNLASGEYFVTATDQITGCVSVISGVVNEPEVLSTGIQFASDPSCNGDCNGVVSAIVDGGTLPYTYGWSSSGNTSATESGLCDGTVTMTITDANGCSTTEDVTLTEPTAITVVVDAVNDATCVNSQDATIDVTASGGAGSFTYSWVTNPSSGFTSSQEDLTGLNPGVYDLTVSDDNGCTEVASVPVDTLFVVLADAGQDSAFCSDVCVTLTGSAVSPTGVLTYEWNTVPATTVLSTADTLQSCPTVSGITSYTLTVTDANCTHTDTVNVEMYAPPVVDAGEDIDTLQGTIVTLGGNPTGPSGSTYYWTPNTNFISVNDSLASNPQIELQTELDYYVFVTDANGCTNSDTIHVRPIPQIIHPNGFTPNGDGVNDDWQIDNIEQFPQSVVEVYNRWGEMLFRSVGYTERWDGTYNGKDLPVGTYYYIIELNDPLYPDVYSGPITIMR